MSDYHHFLFPSRLKSEKIREYALCIIAVIVQTSLSSGYREPPFLMFPSPESKGCMYHHVFRHYCCLHHSPHLMTDPFIIAVAVERNGNIKNLRHHSVYAHPFHQVHVLSDQTPQSTRLS